MANDTRNAVVKLTYELDKNSINQVLRGNKQVENAVESASERIEATGNDAKAASIQTIAALDATIAKFNQYKGSVLSVADAYDEIAERARKIPDPANLANKQQRDRLEISETAGERSSALLRAIPGAEGLANASDFAADAFAAAKAASAAGVSLQTLAGAGLAAGVAAIALTLALDQFNKTVEAGKRGFSAAQTAQEEYYSLLAEGATTEQATERLQELQRAQSALAAEAAEDARAVEDAFRLLSEAAGGGAVGDAAARSAFAAGVFSDLEKAADESSEALAANEQAQGRLTSALDAGSFAANDRAQAERDLNNRILAASQQRVEDATNTAQLIASGNSEAIQSTIDLNTVRMNALIQESALVRSIGDTDAIARLDAQIVQLQSDNIRLEQSVIPVVQAREKEEQALERLKTLETERARSLDQISSIQARLSEQEAADAIADERSAAQRQRQQTLRQIDFQTQLAQSDSDFAERQLQTANQSTELLTESEEERRELEIEFAEQSRRNALDYNRDLLRIQKDLQESTQDAASRLDARAVAAAARAAEKQLEERKEGYDLEQSEAVEARDKRLKELDEDRTDRLNALQQQLRDNAAAYEKQRQARIAAFNLQTQRDAQELAIQAQYRDADRAARIQSAAAQIQMLKNNLDSEAATKNSAYSAMAANTENFAKRIIAAAASINTAAVSASSGGSSTPTPSPFGNNVPTPTPYSISPTASFTGAKSSFSTSPSALAAGSMSIGNVTVQIQGSTNMQGPELERAVEAGLEKVFNKYSGRR